MIILQNTQGNGSQSVQKTDESEHNQFQTAPYGWAPYHCTAEWHLTRLRPVCGLIHPFALYISRKSKTFSCSALNLARYLDYDERSIRDGYNELEALGFFEKIIQGRFNSSIYCVLNHKEWAEKHPNRCVTKQDGSGANDPLGQRLRVLTGMRVRWNKSQIDVLRDFGLPDQQLAEDFVRYYEREGQHKQPRNVPSGFIFNIRNSLKSHIQAVH